MIDIEQEGRNRPGILVVVGLILSYLEWMRGEIYLRCPVTGLLDLLTIPRQVGRRKSHLVCWRQRGKSNIMLVKGQSYPKQLEGRNAASTGAGTELLYSRS